MAWQPIKTVPKNRVVKLFGKAEHGSDPQVCGRWVDSRKAWVAAGTEERLFYLEPTHWAELDPPPVTRP